jgi:radical SAM superfamily enzyme YgiQ (UPF0313 family)
LIKPSHYDDDGYVISWLRSAMPSNTLAVLNGLAEDCARRRVLGDDVEIRIDLYDETNTRIPVRRISRSIGASSAGGLVCLVGVQTNQYPRALDLGRRFRAGGVGVCIGGFHVSGRLAMEGRVTPDLEEAIAAGVSLFAGEAEGRLELVLADAAAGQLAPVYDFLADPPVMARVPTPILSIDRVKRTAGAQASFDAGRGCPFACSFCTIINVQGRESRSRSADDVERIVRVHLERGIRRLFITDDNFARNSNWRPILERLIELKEREGLVFNLVVQVDTQCHRIPGFIEMAARAGVKRVYIGLESINPDNLEAANKPQNRISDYREMLLAWRAVGVCTVAGYIVGFPGDTAESVVSDVVRIRRELPVDMLHFLVLTPLPGSADHKRMLEDGVPMAADLNSYDLVHVTTPHQRMSADEWRRAHRLAWETYYSDEHIITVLRRSRASGISPGKILGSMVWFYGSVVFEGLDPMDAGLIRRKHRRDRRPGLPIENPLVFYPRYVRDLVRSNGRAAMMFLKFHRVRRSITADPRAAEYVDEALTPHPPD